MRSLINIRKGFTSPFSNMSYAPGRYGGVRKLTINYVLLPAHRSVFR